MEGYDAENRQIQTVDANTGLTINYVYDGLGQRVEQQVAGRVTTIFVHDALGQLAAKYNNAGVTPPCTTCYLSYDQLGSVRLITDENQQVVGRHDYLPFGEEIPSGWAGRDAGDMFGVSANVTQMFTGQERDGGSATLDYFNARHLSAVLERFTQPDPSSAGADIFNPQSWNAYGYVLGNPLSNVDPSGMGCDNESTNCQGMKTPPWATTVYSGALDPISILVAQQLLNGSWSGLSGNQATPPTQTQTSGTPFAPSATSQAPNNGPIPQAPQPCLAQRVGSALPGAQFTGVGNAVGGHQQFNFAVNTADLAADGFTPFKVLGLFSNGYRNGTFYLQVHVNGQNGAQLGGGGSGIINVQGHIDVFNPAAGYGTGLILHGIWDLGIGSLFFHHRASLDPGCH